MADDAREVFRHLVFVDHTARLSGAELALREMVGWSLAQQVTVVLHEQGPLEEELRQRGAEVVILPLPAALRLSRSARPTFGQAVRALFAVFVHLHAMWRLLRRLEPDVIYLNTLSALVLTVLPARLVTRRVVWHVRDAISPPHTGPISAWLVRRLVWVTGCAVIANSRFTMEQLRRRPARSPSLVLPSPVPPASPRDEPAGSSSALTVSMVGRLTEWKGQHVFLDAFAEAFGDRLEHRAILAGAALFPGDEAYKASLVEQIHRLGLERRVTLVGHVTDVPELLARSDVLVHASIKPEPFGQVVVQGLLAGTAVVASAAGGPAEIIEADVNGLLVTSGDPEALAQALRRLDDDRGLIRRLVVGSATTDSHYGAQAIEKKLRDFLLRFQERRVTRSHMTGEES